MPFSDTLRRGFYSFFGGGTCAICDKSYSDNDKLVQCADCGSSFCTENVALAEMSKGSGGTQAVHWNRRGIPCGILQRIYDFRTEKLSTTWFCATCAKIDRTFSGNENHVNVKANELNLFSYYIRTQ